MDREGDAFFDNFFPPQPRSCSGLPILSPLTIHNQATDQENENAVIRWVTDTQPIGAARFWVSAADMPTTTRYKPDVCRTSASSLGCHLFTYQNDIKPDQADPDKAEWEKVVSIVEIKHRTTNTPAHNFESFHQLARSTRAVLGTQPARMFVHGIVIAHTTMRCCIFTRSGVNGSRYLDLTLEQDLEICARVLYGHATLPDHKIGILGLTSNVPVTFPNTAATTFTLGPLIPLTNSAPNIVSRATTVWVARNTPNPVANGVVSIEDCNFVVKLSHQYRDRVHEGELYRKCNENAKVKGVAKCYGYRELDSVYNVLGPPCVSAGTVLASQASGKLGRVDKQPHSHTISSAIPIPPSKRHRPLVGNRAGPVTVPDRVAVVLALDRGTPIDQRSSATELFACFRDAIRAHYFLLTAGEILHRDISSNNIMITRPCTPRPDGFRGFLIDLDHSIPINRDSASTSPERAGTVEFMSIRLLIGDPITHSYFDDLQSFLWVFIWTCTRANMRRELKWVGADNMAAGLRKHGLLTLPEMLSGVLQRIGDVVPDGTADEDAKKKGIEAAIRIITQIIVFLPSTATDSDLNKPNKRETFYKDMVAAFDSELSDQDKIGNGWMEM